MATEITIKISLDAQGSNITVGDVQPETTTMVAGEVPAPPPYDEAPSPFEGNFPPPPSVETVIGGVYSDILPPPPPYDEPPSLLEGNVPPPPSGA